MEQLINFGFTRPQCVKALKCTSGNMERAADWLFNHPDDTGKIIGIWCRGIGRGENVLGKYRYLATPA